MAMVITDPTVANDTIPNATPGGLYFYADPSTGKMQIYRYVQFKDAVTYAAGQVLTFANVTGTAVTNDRSGGSSVSNRPAGICLMVNTQDEYGFILVQGYYSAVVTNGDDDIAAGDSLIVATGTDGACDSVAAATTTVHTLAFGHALEADVDASNTVKAWVCGIL